MLEIKHDCRTISLRLLDFESLCIDTEIGKEFTQFITNDISHIDLIIDYLQTYKEYTKLREKLG